MYLKETMFNMTWVEVEEIAKKTDIALIPVGTVEEHGPHLPLGTDTYGSVVLARLVKHMLKERGWDSVIAPPYIFGINYSTNDFPGTMTVRPETLIMILTDICTSLKRMGFKRQFIINHHLDSVHVNALKEAIEVASSETGAEVYGVASFPRPSSLVRNKTYISGAKHWLVALPKPDAANIFESKILDIHAGEGETSMMLCFYSEHVRPNRHELRPASVDLDEFRKGGKAAREQTPLGYVGEPALASAGKGRRAYEYRAASITDTMVKILSKVPA